MFLTFALLGQVPWQAVREGRTADTISFTIIRDVTTDLRGERIFAFDARLNRVVITNHSGAQVGTIGRPGDGPGEFARVRWLGWRGDTLTVVEVPNRLHYFSPAGRVYRTITTPPVGIVYSAAPDGFLLLESKVDPSQPQGDGIIHPYRVSHHAGTRVRNVAQFLSFVRPLQVRASINGTAGTTYQEEPFRDDELARVDREGKHVFIVDRRTSNEGPHTFRIVKLSHSGDTVFARRYPYRPVSLDRGAVDAKIDELVGTIRTQSSKSLTVVERGDLAKEIYRPFHLPPVEQILVGRDGTIWLKRESLPTSKTSAYLVLSPKGEPIGSVRLPAKEQLVEANRQRVWTIAKDEDDVPFVVWYRLKR